MENEAIKKNVESLIDTFLYAGKISLELRKKGLIKKIKSDNTPVSNGDLEVNKVITKKNAIKKNLNANNLINFINDVPIYLISLG